VIPHARVEHAFDAPFVPARVLSVEVTSALPDPLVLGSDDRRGVSFRRALIVVRVHASPVGVVEVAAPDGTISAAQLAAVIDGAMRARILGHLEADGLPGDWRAAPHVPQIGQLPACLAARAELLANQPSVSVVIPTIDRPDALRACLEAVLAQPLPRFEVIVVDNAPGESGAREVVAALDPGTHTLRYDPQPQRGASRARNRGLKRASGEIVAFLDGDARPDPTWLPALVAAMATPLDGAAMPTCATGPILPDDLVTEPQAWLEEWGGFAKGFERRVYDRGRHTSGSPLYPFAAGTFGSGANMAFRTAAFRRLGGFDTALGPGTPARGGEDLAAFVSVITSGGSIVYAPDAIVWHAHHDTEDRFRSTIRAYGTGLAAYLTRHAAHHPADAIRMALAMPAAAAYFLRSGSPRNVRRSARFPPGLWKDEVAGMVIGPFAYVLGRLRARRERVRSGGSGRSRGARLT
jgi:GT2 family glycosyltransferase